MSEPRNDCPYCQGAGYTIEQIGVEQDGTPICDTRECGCYTFEPPKDE